MTYEKQLEKDIEALRIRRAELMEMLVSGGHEYERKFMEITSQIHCIDQSIATKKRWIQYKGKCPTALTKDVIIPNTYR
jgi:hypothetical protein